ncbi:MAG: PHP domain-containing protein [Candidatus Nealsonbacteria bacterium]|nr:PHP domain-containing protein [Candidatus Nealsonbacteria bacterium]
MAKADLHIHSYYSPDAFSSPREILAKAKRAGLDLIAITDHHTIDGAKEAQKIASEFGLEVVVGEEILTAQGEIIGLFLKEEIIPHLPLLEAIDRIKKQGGLVVIPHPLGFWQDGLGEKIIHKICDKVDGIEIFNAGWMSKKDLVKIKYLNDNFFKLSATGGSDAHFAQLIGKAYTVFNGKSAGDLYSAIKNKSTCADGQFWSKWDYISYLRHWMASKSIRRGPLIVFDFLWGVRKLIKLFRKFPTELFPK